MASVAEILERHKATLMAIPGVVGVSPGPDRIIVYVESENVIYRIPAMLEGVPLFTVVVGKVRPL
jgi:hypothetical protein